MMFQPSMLGVEQAGLAEIIEFILKKYPPEIQNSLVQVGVVAESFSDFTNSFIQHKIIKMKYV